MSEASALQLWFATDRPSRLLLIHRLEWRKFDAKRLDQHICRCIDKIGQALIAEVAGVISISGYGPGDDTGKACSNDLY